MMQISEKILLIEFIGLNRREERHRHPKSVNSLGVWDIRPPDPGPHIRPSARGSHKSFINFNLILVKAQWLWSCAYYFQWFTGYLNHVDLLMSYVHVLKKLPHCLKVHLSYFADFILCPTDKYMFKVNNKKM